MDRSDPKVQGMISCSMQNNFMSRDNRLAQNATGHRPLSADPIRAIYLPYINKRDHKGSNILRAGWCAVI
jgi:hypothetical protein